MNAREYTPRSRSRSALARHLHEREVRWRLRRVREHRVHRRARSASGGRRRPTAAPPTRATAAARRRPATIGRRTSDAAVMAAVSIVRSGRIRTPVRAPAVVAPAATLGAARMPPQGTSSRSGSPMATPVTATVPSRARWSSSSQRSWRTTCAPSTMSTRRVAGPDSRPTTETQAGRSPASARGAAGAASSGVVWPAAEPSLTIGTPITGSDPAAWRPPRSSAKGGRRSRVNRATSGRTMGGRRPGARRPRAARRPASPSTDRRRWSRRSEVRDRSAVPRSSSEPVGPAYGPPDPRRPSRPRAAGRAASTGDGRGDPHLRSGARPDSVSLVRLRTAGLLADHSAHLDPGASAERIAVGTQGGSGC